MLPQLDPPTDGQRRVAERLETGRRPATDPAAMARAAAAGAEQPPRYVRYQPPRFNRPFPS